MKGTSRRPPEPTTKPTWESMTPEERERYINQDIVEKDTRIITGVDKLEILGEHRGTTADLYQSGGYLDPETEATLTKYVDPVELECVRLYHGEGMTYKKIADSISVLYVTKERIIKSHKLTKHIVHKMLRSGRKAMKQYVESKTD